LRPNILIIFILILCALAVEKNYRSIVTLKNMESENRNNQGRFVSGHKGSKPKGAMNKNTRDYLARLDKINTLLESNLEDNISSLSKKDQVMLWLDIQKFMHVKMSKFTEPDPAKEQINKITFQVVDSQGRPYHAPPDTPAIPVAEAPATPQTGQIRPPADTYIQYGAIDVGRVRRPGYINRTRSI
jgi:hypothetical protein